MIDREPIPFKQKIMRPTVEQSIRKAIEDPNLNPECRMRLWLSLQPKLINRPQAETPRKTLRVRLGEIPVKHDMNDHI